MDKDRHIIKSHNKNLLLYHFVCPAKYRRKVFTKEVEETIQKYVQNQGKNYNQLYRDQLMLFDLE